jgi:hypothetical protein
LNLIKIDHRKYHQVAIKHRDLAFALPELYVVTINELLGVFFGAVVVRADKFNGPGGIDRLSQ